MKIIYFIVVFNLYLFQAKAYEYPYKKWDDSYTDSTVPVEISDSTPIKSQDGIGLCYAFSVTSLLENYRCRELHLDCSDPKEFLSPLDVSSYYQNKSLVEGGEPIKILSNIQRSKRKIAKEECVQFSALVHQMTDDKNLTYKNEKIGWSFLVQKWNEYKSVGVKVKSNDCVECLALEIKNALPNIQTPMRQLENAFTNAHTQEEFLYKSLLPVQCLEEENMIDIPSFVAKSYPGNDTKADASSLSKKVESLLLSNTPLEMSICTAKTFDGKCQKDKGHSIALFGIKQVCNTTKSDCKSVVKIKNSYGNQWQLQNNDGWVDLQTLVESSFVFESGNKISWIEKPGFVLTEKSLSKNSTQSKTSFNDNTPTKPSEYKGYTGMWKCPGAKFIDHYEAGCVPYKSK